ncbi:hypothetical protein SEA_FORZA_86 [Gordonia phage Forza]|uniref:Uncharacterized protein n=1 Tax=Gordonia phage Forza TaxID=2571247 RepID=A0A650EZ23_9CAUD|nr:hypothetical protein PP303_gp086 [Gordonia phage Forza]QGT55079.1 hypothetical protein SEA_FORZA_86 [Gordonia phage Forza]
MLKLLLRQAVEVSRAFDFSFTQKATTSVVAFLLFWVNCESTQFRAIVTVPLERPVNTVPPS